MDDNSKTDDLNEGKDDNNNSKEEKQNSSKNKDVDNNDSKVHGSKGNTNVNNDRPEPADGNDGAVDAISGEIGDHIDKLDYSDETEVDRKGKDHRSDEDYDYAVEVKNDNSVQVMERPEYDDYEY